jgi:L-lactate permease
MLLIRQMLTSVSDDKRVQAVLIAFAFGGFLGAAD